MNEIITISQAMINNTEVNAVNARDLHEVLESDTKFSDWIKRRLDETDAILNANYMIVSQKRETITEYGKKASIITEYILTTDIAKEIAMMERNEKGKQVRRYFIEVEKAYKRDKVTVSQLDYMQIQLNYLKEKRPILLYLWYYYL